MKPSVLTSLALVAGLVLASILTGCKPTPPPPSTAVTVQDPVHVTRTGRSYHRAGCRYLDSSDFIESRQDAIGQGLNPCSLCEPATPSPTQPVRIEMVHVTKSGTCYHRAGCSSLDRSDFLESRQEAVHQGLRPCPKCGS